MVPEASSFSYKSVIERILENDDSIFSEPDLIQGVTMSSQGALFLLFSACYDARNMKAVDWILDNIRDPTSYVDPESYIFSHPLLSDLLLSFVVDANLHDDPEKEKKTKFNIANCIDCLIMLDSNDETYAACAKAVRILGTTDFISWVNFAMTAEDYGNETVWEFCCQQAKHVAPYRPKPIYIKKAPKLDKLVETPATSVRLPPPPLEDHDKVSPAVLDNMVQDLENNVERFRFLGPSNFVTGARARDILSGEAELRMFNDNRMIDEEYDSWFTGNCDECWYKIKKLRYAVRKPLEGGGWSGCFCSWECVVINCDENEEIVPREMASFFDKKVKEIGIYDL